MHNQLAAPGKTGLDDSRVKVLEAIARSVLLRARYNSQPLLLAPHALFARRGELFLSALNLTKNWRASEERHLGYFKLAGLAGVEVTAEAFDPLPDARTLVGQIDDELVLSVS